MSNRQPVPNDIEDRNRLSLDELDAVNGGNILRDIWNNIKAAICIKNANCDIDHSGVLR